MKKFAKVIFTPDDEPYLGQPKLYELDKMIILFLEKNSTIAAYTQKNKVSLTNIERAGCTLIPSSFTLILSIRELLRQGYLYGAAVLMRPVVERVAILSYLCDKPGALEIWGNGWKLKERPSFRELIENMGKSQKHKGQNEFISILHSLIHGGEDSLSYGGTTDSLGRQGFSASKSLKNPKKCNDISHMMVCMLLILLARRDQIFPQLNGSY
ncbi:MAG: hypothetical protein ACRCWR_08340 [Saezia sp.]